MAYTTIDKPTDYFNTVLYTGTGSSNSVTGVGFQPDWVWLKKRNSTGNNFIYDSVRGVQQTIYTDATSAEATQSQGLTAFGTDGFTVGTNTNINGSSNTNVSWNWLASNTTASNTDGSITSSVSANTTAGFSIVSYTGTGANATVGHGLGVAPKMIITKARGTTNNWGTYHESLGNTDAVFLNLTNATDTASTYWNNTSPTSSVYSVGSAAGTNPSATMIAYCFAEKKGYSKFGSYTGNGNNDGTFVYTGFKPAFVMSKRTDSADGWRIMDTARSTYNVAQHRLLANASDAEVVLSSQDKDFLSNGFKIRTSDSGYNTSGGTYIYMAFAENPFVTSGGIPCTAR